MELMVAITASAIESAPSNVQSTAEQAESEMQIYWCSHPLVESVLTTGHLSLGCSRIWVYYQWNGYSLCYRCLSLHQIHITAPKRNYERSLQKKQRRAN